MKKIILVLSLLVFFACTNETESISYESQYITSLADWDYYKSQNGNSYVYTVNFESWSGVGDVTTITVTNGAVTQRSYESYDLYDVDGNFLGWSDRVVLDSYTESDSEVGENTSGAEAVNIDSLYIDCVSDVLSVDSSVNSITFTTDEANILQNCYYTPNGCMDDCSFGVFVTSITWL